MASYATLYPHSACAVLYHSPDRARGTASRRILYASLHLSDSRHWVTYRVLSFCDFDNDIARTATCPNPSLRFLSRGTCRSIPSPSARHSLAAAYAIASHLPAVPSLTHTRTTPSSHMVETRRLCSRTACRARRNGGDASLGSGEYTVRGCDIYCNYLILSFHARRMATKPLTHSYSSRQQFWSYRGWRR